MKKDDMNKILEIGVQLSSERNLYRLLAQILLCVMDLTRCDAGTLYLLENDALQFKIMRNNTLHTYSGEDGNDPDLPPVPLSRSNVCAYALLEDKTIRIEDVKNCQEYDFSGPAKYDAITGYHTQSMLVVPMSNREGEKLGVLQLINALDEEGHVRAFAEDMVLMVKSVASQAAITIQNVRYIREIKDLFHSFVRTMSSAVNERTPYTANHARHMAAYGSNFIDFLNQCEGQKHFTPTQKEELLMSIWLHDIGKLVTPLEVMDKAKRLLPQQHTAFTHRLEVVRLNAEISMLKGLISPEEKDALIQQTEEAAQLVDKINSAGFVTDEMLEELDQLQKKTYAGEDGAEHPWLAQEEYAMLSIRRGTLSEKERKTMEEHVVVTDKLLSQILFPGDMSHVREWASSHHELLNGKGYPHHRKGEEIPYEVRIITILDIFDALVADDRPYKPAKPLHVALDILKENAEVRGELDPELTKLFIESKCWENADDVSWQQSV